MTFNDGMIRRINLARLLEGPVFAPLREPAFFARMTVDPGTGTVTWPNGADLAPEALRDLPEEREEPADRSAAGG